MLHTKHATALILRVKTWTRNDGNCRSSIFSKSVARMQRAAGKQLVCILAISECPLFGFARINPNLLRANESGSSQHILLCLQAENAPRSSSWMLPAVDSSTASNWARDGSHS
jgi:hypothetical protein